VKALNIALWVAQVLLGLAFLMAGVMKTTRPIADLAAAMTWVPRVPPAEVRFIGAAELLGALGLLLPSLTRILPKLTVVAALGLVVVMILAAAHHLTHGEGKMVPINVVLGGLALFIAWGRWKKVPIVPR
jgi:putative oxidoreductase